jgi:hypothetical protein
MALVAGGFANASGNRSGSSAGGTLDLTSIGATADDLAKKKIVQSDAQAEADARNLTLQDQAFRESQTVQQQAASSQDATRQQQLKVLDGLNGLLSKANTAMKLSDSQNPMDRLKLWALQQSDPAYTREGNLNRMAYLQSAANALGGVDAIKQSGYQAQLDGIQRRLASAQEPDKLMLAQLQIGVDQGTRTLAALTEAQDTRLKTLQTQNSMQEAALANLTIDQVSTAEQAATNSPDGNANIGGVNVSLAQIQTRKDALQTRQWLTWSRQIQGQDAALANMTSADVDKAITEAAGSKSQSVEIGGVTLSLARLQARKVDLSNQAFGQKQNEYSGMIMDKAMHDMTQQKLLDTYSVTELNNIITNGGVDSQGNKFDLAKVQATRDLIANARDSQIAQQAAVANIGDPGAALVDFDRYLKGVSANAPEGSPLAQTVKSKTQIFQFAASMLNSKDPDDIAHAAQIMQGTREDIEKAIDDQAKLMSAGDKDVATALQYKLRGQAIPPELIANAILTRAAAGKPIGNWLTPANAQLFNQTFREAKTQLKLTQPMADSKTLDQQAGELAMKAVMDSASAGMTEQVLQFQLSQPDNPLTKAGLSGTQVLTMYRQADQLGAKQYQANANLSDDEMAKRLSGALPDPNLAATQASMFYQSLEKIKKGLGDAYVDWWNSPARTSTIGTFATSLAMATSQSSMAQMSEQSLLIPTLQDQWGQYATLLNQGQQQYYSADLAKEHAKYVAFQGNPTSEQAFLLQTDKNLTDTEKQQAMALIFQPLIAQAKANGLGSSDTSLFIEQSLKTMKPEDPAVGSLLKKIMLNRDTSLKLIDDFAGANILDNNPMMQILSLGWMPGISQAQNALNSSRLSNALDSATSNYKWMQDLNQPRAGK